MGSKSKEQSFFFFFETSLFRRSWKKLLSCTKKDYKEELVLDYSDSELNHLKSSTKKLLKRSWLTAKLTEIKKQMIMNTLKSYPLWLFSLPILIDTAVGRKKKQEIKEIQFVEEKEMILK